ncbi:unnamed protein product [Phyllotreta striolata]|uniref:Transcription factor CBF/NF-Y/archaeal histone domain-containing protein n=1 Tax=Phyllotreta striolata TaxID=444603 RepID=A0A9N9TXY3_PHYSR|nr:unnamed protein product [Phyllotreta striolata]
MPSKKKKYNARFPAGRIKKIMQTDEEVGKVAQAVPVIISRTLELFVESLLTKSMQITQSRNAKTLTPSHMKQCILAESRFDFLKDLVKDIPDASVQEDNENNAMFDESSVKQEDESLKDPIENPVKEPHSSKSKQSRRNANVPHTEVHPLPTININYSEQSTSRTPVIQYSPRIGAESSKLNFSVNSLLKTEEPKLHITIASEELQITKVPPGKPPSNSLPPRVHSSDTVPPLVPITRLTQSSENNLYIDDDYDN